MVTVNAHFDGKVIVPDEPLDLPANQKLRVQVKAIESQHKRVDLTWLRGAGKASGANPHPRFKTNDDLWDKSR